MSHVEDVKSSGKDQICYDLQINLNELSSIHSCKWLFIVFPYKLESILFQNINL